MLRKNERISRDIFDSILKNGRSFHAPLVSLSVTKSKNPDKSSQFSCVVSKKVAKQAVQRNILRRRCYSIIKKHEKSIKPGNLCVFFYKKGSDNIDFKEIEKEIINLLKKAKLISL